MLTLPVNTIIYTIIYQQVICMNSFKSSPLIQDRPNTRITRKSRRISNKRFSKEQQFLIANPFRHADEENLLPSDLKNQLEPLDYISPTHIQNITFTTAGARRSSTFARHLQTMQNAAKKQAQMYQFFMGCKQQKKQSCQAQLMQQQQPLTMDQNDNLSTKMNQCFLMMDNDHVEREPINFFELQSQEEDIIFYSQNVIQSEDLGEEYQAYFDV